MGSFLRTCGIGILVIISSPLWLALFLIYVLIGTLFLLVSPLRLLICLFKGKKLTIKTDYDKKAEAILKANAPKTYSQTQLDNQKMFSYSQISQPQYQNNPQQQYSQGGYFQPNQVNNSNNFNNNPYPPYQPNNNYPPQNNQQYQNPNYPPYQQNNNYPPQNNYNNPPMNNPNIPYENNNNNGGEQR